ncbi:hypothetical protein OROMI_019552 [Orobanche minor]
MEFKPAFLVVIFILAFAESDKRFCWFRTQNIRSLK